MNTLIYITIALSAFSAVGILILMIRTKSSDSDISAKDLYHLEDKLSNENRLARQELAESIDKMRKEVSENVIQMREETTRTINQQRTEFADNVSKLRKEFTENAKIQRDESQNAFTQLVQSTEKKLDEMRATVDEKLQKTLNERIGQSFKLVSEQLENVQKGLGEMKNLASDVGGLKNALTNVKIRGNFGELQLKALLEQMLSPEQYDENVATIPGSTERVEFAIKLPGNDELQSTVYLPIDSKFPKDVYDQYIDALDNGDTANIKTKSQQFETTIIKMAKDIQSKYVSVPDTTDFAIMFVPVENIYAEVIRRAGLMQELRDKHHVLVTGPTTLGALLSSLQMGFRTLAIQKRSSEVWKTLGAIKTEFGKFETLLEKAQNNLMSAYGQLDELKGTRTRAINRKLRDIEELPANEAATLLPDLEEE